MLSKKSLQKNGAIKTDMKVYCYVSVSNNYLGVNE